MDLMGDIMSKADTVLKFDEVDASSSKEAKAYNKATSELGGAISAYVKATREMGPKPKTAVNKFMRDTLDSMSAIQDLVDDWVK